MATDDFVHLHVHTEFSMLDGHALINDMLDEVQNLGQRGIAITDHGNMHGAYALWKEARARDLIPVIGIEAYMTPGGHHHSHKEPIFFGQSQGSDREEGADDVSSRGTYTHMTMLAETTEGMHNLFRMSSLSFIEGMYKKPRMSIDMLAEHSKGIIATTGCPSGDIQTRLRLGQYDQAREFAGRMQDILGRDNYFLELMEHDMKSDLERGVRDDLLRLAKELNIPLLATNDLHYTKRSDAPKHEAMLAMQTRSTMNEPTYEQGGKRFAFEGDSYYVKSSAEMAKLFGHLPEALSNTVLIAERAAGAMFEETDLRPAIDIPEGHTPESYIREQVNLGLVKRFGAENITQEIKDRVEYELSVIVPKRYIMYFLVVSDFVRWAKKNGVTVGAARGCLHGDSPVMTPNGIKPIRHLRAGDTVFDQTGQPVVIPNHLAYKTEESLVDIKGYFGGNGIKMTPDHKVLVSKAAHKYEIAQGYTLAKGAIAKPEWLRADEVEVGDLVVMPKLQFPTTTTSFNIPETVSSSQQNARGTLPANRDLGFLLGLFISDGWISEDSQAVVGFAENRNRDTGVIPDIIERVFGIRPIFQDHNEAQSRQYFIDHVGVRKWIAELFPDYEFTAHSKYIPRALLETSDEFRRGLLDGLWYSNGCNGVHSTYTTVSMRLAHGVHTLLLSLGLPSSIKEYNSAEKHPEYNKDGKDSYQVFTVSSMRDFDTKNFTHGVAYDGQYTYYRVREINNVDGDGTVYDFTVPTTHSYVTDSFVVHNSAGGSLVAYALEITELDPMRHKLLFERFLNPERDSPPDIDMDFDDRNRERVIDYVRNKYGDAYVGYVTTFGKIKAKSAIRDAAKVLERPIALSNSLTKAYPPGIMGKEMPLSDVYDPMSKRYHEAEEFRQLVVAENAEKVVEVARGVENRIRQTGVHAAGIIISSKPLIDAVPLMTRSNNPTLITQFDYPTCETLGLLKVDFLGLSNLTILRDAMDNIKKSRGEEIDLYAIFEGPMDDPATYKLLQEGNALGVFQLDSGAIRDLLRRISPTSFDDISAAIALYRPGPMGVNAHLDYADRKNGRQPVNPIHPELEQALEPVLGESYGLCIYQEQVMQAAQHLAGYTLAEADNLRRAMGKKKKEVLDKEFIPFSSGMKKNGFSDESIKALWDVLVPFADYAFNKSHSVGYGLISYATAYLKANYPSEYMAALLTTSSDDPDKMAVYLQECKRMGLKVLPPSVNRSHVDYAAPAKDEVIVGLSNIRNVGHKAAESIIESRPEGGYKNIQDLMGAVPKEMLNKRVLEGLAASGALDDFGLSRRALAAAIPDLVQAYSALKKKESEGQESLFNLFGEEEEETFPEVKVRDLPEFSKKEKLSRERYAIGLYVSDHPLSEMARSIETRATATTADIKNGDVPVAAGFDNSIPKQTIAGLLSSLEVKTSKKGDRFAIITIEDMVGSIEAPIFPKMYEQISNKLVQDNIYVFTGTPRYKDGSGDEDAEINFMIDHIEELETDDAGRMITWFRINEDQKGNGSGRALQQVLAKHKGDNMVYVSIKNRDGSIEQVNFGENYRVDDTAALRRDVQVLFGTNCIGRW